MSDIRPDIWRLQAQFDTQGLIDALKDDDAGYRKRAASALRALGAVDAVPALRVAMVNEHDPDVRAHIAAALDALTDDPHAEHEPPPEAQPGEVDKLVAELKTGDEDLITEASRRLGELGDKTAVEPLVAIFNDAKVSMQVRLAVAEALLKLESAPVEVTLLAVLRHNDWHIRRNGAAMLGLLKADWAIEPLVRALRDKHPVVRKTALAALKHIGTPEAKRILAKIQKKRQQSGANTPQAVDTQEARRILTDTARKGGGLLSRMEGAKQENPEPPVPELVAQDTDDEEDADTSWLEDTGAPSGFAWPKTDEPAAIHLNPTQPLNPHVLEEAERRREQAAAEALHEDTDADDSASSDTETADSEPDDGE